MFLVEEEGTASSLRGLHETIAGNSLFAPLYTRTRVFPCSGASLSRRSIAIFHGPRKLADYGPDGCLREPPVDNRCAA